MKKLLPEFSFRVFGHLQTLSFAMPARLEQSPSHPLVCFQGFLEFAKRTNKIAQFFHKMWQFFTLPEFRHLGRLKPVEVGPSFRIFLPESFDLEAPP